MVPTIRNFNDLSCRLNNNTKLLVLYSGGLDSSFLIYWLKTVKKIKSILALNINLGGVDEVDLVHRNATKLGVKLLSIDKQEEFFRSYILSAIKAQARYLNQYPISASLSRPLLAKCAVEVAIQHRCDAILHCSTISQNSLRRFNTALSDLQYSGTYGSPYEFSCFSREDKRRALKKYLSTDTVLRYNSSDINIWCREFESGNIDNIENFVWPTEKFLWTKPVAKLPSINVELRFEQGIPVALNNTPMSGVDLINQLNYNIGAYNIGRFIGLEELTDGVKFPEIREMPAAEILLNAYKQIESASLDAEVIREKMHIEQVWVREAVEGRWYGVLRQSANEFIEYTAKKINGIVNYKITMGNMQLTKMQVKKPKYQKDRNLFEKEHLKGYQNIGKGILEERYA